MKHIFKLRIFNTIGFVVFCLAIGQAISLVLTGLAYDMNTFQIAETLKDPTISDRDLIIFYSLLCSVLSFLIVPVTYLLLVEKASVRFLMMRPKIRVTPLLLSTIIVVTLLPVITILIKLNYSITFPIWLSELENYFKGSEENARQIAVSILHFSETKDLIIAIVVVAIIPGIVEEVFFRGIVQTQLQDTFKNSHYAIWTSAFLFSLLHFQFYGFIPRLLLGALFGYIFQWSKSIWYSCAAHVANNLIGILGYYYIGPRFLSPETEFLVPLLLVIPSVAITGLIILRLKRIGISREEVSYHS